MRKITLLAGLAFVLFGMFLVFNNPEFGDASSHREAPLISNDPLADNTDLFMFVAPDAPDQVVIMANYIPLELPEGGPNYNTFGEDIRYEIHIKNQTSVGALGTATDDITYRFTFSQMNEDPTTFFNIRLGENLKTTYTCEKSTDGGQSFTTIVTGGIVPPNNIGPRSTSFAGASSYDQLAQSAITTASTGETIFCGPRDDIFFVDLGGVFDLGQTRPNANSDPTDPDDARDAVAGFNTHSIIIKTPISSLQKDGKTVDQASNILDGDFVIGAWASASRQAITTLNPDGTRDVSGPWVQVSRIGMPLTNEVIIPIQDKDFWNAVSPYSTEEQSFVKYLVNPELALYMDDGSDTNNPAAGLGDLIPGLSALRVQSMSYPAIGIIPGYSDPGFDFRTAMDGAFAAAFIPGIDFTGTAIAVATGPAAAGMPAGQTALVGPGEPRRADILPIFYFGIPNLIPYHLATGKTGGPLSAGKPFINNFLPITSDNDVLYGGDMLRLNMATPVTDRSSTEFADNAYLGLIRAAAIGLTAAPFNTTADLEFIPHMDGFPNGRRMEDDVTTIELQAVGGLVLAAVGFGFDDAVAADYSDLASPALVAELTYDAGPISNDIPLLETFPYAPNPHSGYDYVKALAFAGSITNIANSGLGLSVPKSFNLDQNYPNPFNPSTTIQYQVKSGDFVKLKVYNMLGQEVTTLVNEFRQPGNYSVNWDAKGLASGAYYYRLEVGGETLPAKKALFIK